MAEVLIVLIIFGAIFGRGLLRSFYSHREKMRAIELHNSSADTKRENSELSEKWTSFQSVSKCLKNSHRREISPRSQDCQPLACCNFRRIVRASYRKVRYLIT